MASDKNDPLNIFHPSDLRKCREQALKLSKWGDTKGLIPVRIDSRTIVFRKPEKLRTKG